MRGEEGAKTAGPGEVIFLTKGTKVTYQAEVAALVAGRSRHAHLLDAFHPV